MMLLHYKLQLNNIELEQLKAVAARNINKMQVSTADMRFMMYYVYREKSHNSSDQHIKQLINKKITCSDCRARTMIYIENWFERYAKD